MRVKYQAGYICQGRALCFHDFCLSSLHIEWWWGTPGEWDVVWSLWKEQVVRLRTASLRKTFLSKKREKEWLPLGAVQAIDGPLVLLLSGNHRMTSCMFLIDSESSWFQFLSSFSK